MKTLSDYADRIRSLEGFAQARPAAYRARVAGLAALGIGYVVLAFLAALACAAAAIAAIAVSHSGGLIKLAWLPLTFAWMIGKAMWIRLDPPEGRPVSAREAPRLFEEIESVRRALNAQRIHGVVLSRDFNAAVCQVPRLGILGWPRNYLILGLPLLAGLPVEEVRAVLGHEFGHLARSHARFGNWIYRTRQIWSRVLVALEASSSRASRLFTRFIDWYAPFFNAYSFVLARANEYEADRESARVAGAQTAAQALTAVSAKGEYLGSLFWRDFYAPAAMDPEPPKSPYSHYLASLRVLEPEVGRSCLTAALEQRTTLGDTHPCLADRLAALGAAPQPLEAVGVSAAESLLGALAAQLAAEADADWLPEVEKAWHDQYAFLAQNRERLERFRSSEPEQLSADDYWDYARAMEAETGALAALPLLERAISLNPTHAAAHYDRGRIRLRQREEGGVADIERAMQLDSDALEPGSQLLYQFYYARNELGRCQPYLDTLRRIEAEREQGRRERAGIGPADVLDSHGLTAEQVEPFAAAARTAPGLRRAWMARKRVKHSPEVPAYAVVLEFRWWRSPTQATLQAVLNAMPNGPSIIVLNKDRNRRVSRRIRACTNALIVGG